MVQDSTEVAQHAFPDALPVGGAQLPLEYHVDPGHQADGVNLVVPLAPVNRVPADRCEWLVPGLMEERLIALLRGLPKTLRKAFVPIPDTAARLLGRLQPSDRPLIQAIGEALREVSGQHVPEDAWDLSAIPDHLRMRFRIIDDKGREVAGGRDFAKLRREHGGKGAEVFARLPDVGLERDGITRWDFSDLPETVEMERGGIRLQGHPALVDQGGSVAIQVLDSAEAAELAMRIGQRRLLLLSLPQDTRYLRKNLPGLNAMRLQYAKAPARNDQTGDIENELVALIIDRTFFTGRPRVIHAAEFEARIASHKGELMGVAGEVCKLAAAILASYQKIRRIEKRWKALGL